jgi:hypothetical protein
MGCWVSGKAEQKAQEGGNMMPRRTVLKAVIVSMILAVSGLLSPYKVLAHCDGLDGPVVLAAQNALETGNVNLVLIWVQKQDEAEIKDAFQQILAVRTLSPAARELADRYFFETLMRIHG